MDLRKLSPAELENLISKARKRQTELASRKIPRVRRKIEAILLAEGLTLADVFGPKGAQVAALTPHKPKGANAGRKVRAKFRNPADPTQTWAGRGGQPRWFREALARGISEQQLLIRPLPFCAGARSRPLQEEVRAVLCSPPGVHDDPQERDRTHGGTCRCGFAASSLCCVDPL